MNLPRPLSILLLVSIVLHAGCDIPKRPPLTERLERPRYDSEDLTAPATLQSDTNPVAPTFEPPEAPLVDNWETWNAYYSDGKHIGFGHISAKRLSDSPSADTPHADVQYTIKDHLLLSVGQSIVQQVLHHESIESSTGQLKGFRASQSVGPLATQFTASVENNELTVVTRRGFTESTQKIRWEPTYRGLVAVEQSLNRSPMKTGEVRLLQTLLPVQHRIATVRLVGGTNASAPLLGGKSSELLEISGQISVDENYSDIVLWTDDSGTMLKSYTEALGLLAFRTDEATATADIQPMSGPASGVTLSVTGIIERPNEAKRTAFIIKKPKPRRSRKPIDAVSTLEIAMIPGQAQRRISDDTLQVLVSLDSAANVPNFVTADLGVSDSDTRPSALIDFQSALVRRFQSAASITGLNERETALEMARTAKGVLEMSQQCLGLTKASEVAQAGVADSTGHAVLLAALLRASNIPARIVGGLIFDDAKSTTMKYHAWTLAHVNGTWIPLDATLGGEAPSNRIALMNSDFNDKNAEADIVALIRKIGELQIEIARSQY